MERKNGRERERKKEKRVMTSDELRERKTERKKKARETLREREESNRE